MTRSTSSAAGEPLQPSNRVIFEVPVERLVPSPTQPRTRNRDGADLVESVREHGVLEPLWIRSSTTEGFYEIIFGERRWGASKLAGRGSVPAELRDDLSTQDIVVLQNIENGQREDVSPLDEARSYQLLQQRFGRSTHEVAMLVQKSEARVLRRLRLLLLPEPAQRAIEDGSLQLRSAEALARIQHPEDREAAAARVLMSEMSPLQVTRLVEREYMLRLAEAQFDPDDAQLVPAAGACSRCPKRSGAQMLLYAEAGEEEDRCSDRSCFEAKKAAHWVRVSAEGLRVGARIVDGGEAAKLFPSGYMSGRAAQEFVELDNPCYMVPPDPVPWSEGAKGEDADEELPQPATWRDALRGQDVPVTLVRDPSGRVHAIVPRAEAVQALASSGKLKAAEEEPRIAPNAGRATAEARIARAAEQGAYEKALGAIAEKAAETKPGLAFWRFLCALLLEVLYTWNLGDIIARRGIDVRADESETDAILRHVASAKEGEARGLALEIMVSSQGDVSYASQDSALHIAARFFGVDLKKIHAAALRKARDAAAKDAETAKAKRGANRAARPSPASTRPSAVKTSANTRVCDVCGCTDDAACEGGCAWVDYTLCSACSALQERILEVLGEKPMTLEELRSGLETEEQPFAARTQRACEHLIGRKLVREREGKLDLVQRRLFAAGRKGRGNGALAHAEAP